MSEIVEVALLLIIVGWIVGTWIRTPSGKKVHEDKIRAKAWEEGYNAQWEPCCSPEEDCSEVKNPYRQGELE